MLRLPTYRYSNKSKQFQSLICEYFIYAAQKYLSLGLINCKVDFKIWRFIDFLPLLQFNRDSWTEENKRVKYQTKKEMKKITGEILQMHTSTDELWTNNWIVCYKNPNKLLSFSIEIAMNTEIIHLVMLTYPSTFVGGKYHSDISK